MGADITTVWAGEAGSDGDELTVRERAALDLAAAAGTRAADWIRGLAGRQCGAGDVFAALAGTVATVMTGLDPYGDGDLGGETRYELTESVRHTVALPGVREQLGAAERLALVLVGALVADAPAVVLGDFDLALPLLCETIDDALAHARSPGSV